MEPQATRSSPIPPQPLPGMYVRGFGRILNTSAVHGLRASPNKPTYVAAKHV